MSLVNEMLQDLDTRRGERAMPCYSALNVRVGRAGSRVGVRRATVVGVLLMVAAAVMYVWQQPADQIEPAVVATSVASATSTPESMGIDRVEIPLIASELVEADDNNNSVNESNVNESNVNEGNVHEGNVHESRLGKTNVTKTPAAVAPVSATVNIGEDVAVKPAPQTTMVNSPESTLPSGTLHVALSAAAVDQQRAEAARQQAASGDLDGAIAMLRSFHERDVAGRATTAALADLYLQRQQPQQALALVENQTLLPEEQAAYLIARAQVQEGELSAALVTLESRQPNLVVYPQYYALQAGIYQQGGQNHVAAQLYRRLTLLQPDNYTHWLGLAVSLDELREPGALNAFRQALSLLPKQRSDLRDYARKRIASLVVQ